MKKIIWCYAFITSSVCSSEVCSTLSSKVVQIFGCTKPKVRILFWISAAFFRDGLNSFLVNVVVRQFTLLIRIRQLWISNLETDYSDGIFRSFLHSFRISVKIAPQVKATSFHALFTNYYLLNIVLLNVIEPLQTTRRTIGRPKKSWREQL